MAVWLLIRGEISTEWHTWAAVEAVAPVYRLHKNAAGTWVLAVLASLHPAANAVDHLLVDSNNNIYGTAQNSGGDANDGYVFEITPVNGQWRFKYLHIFTGQGDGANPLGALVMDSARQSLRYNLE